MDPGTERPKPPRRERNTDRVTTGSGPVKRVMLIALDATTRAKVERSLDRLSCRISTADDAASALEILCARQYSLVVMGYPLPHLLLRHLVQRLRHPVCASHRCSLLILSIPELMTGALRFVNHGANSVLPRWASRAQLDLAILKLLDVAERYPPSPELAVQIEDPSGAPVPASGVVNISVSGLLVRSSVQPVLGSTVRTILRHPSLPHPLELPARVVRFAKPSRENLGGFAVNFDGADLDPVLPVLIRTEEVLPREA